MRSAYPILLLLLVGQALGEDKPLPEAPTWAAAMTGARQSYQPSATDREKTTAALVRDLWQRFPEMDWFLQDNPHRATGSVAFDPQREFAWYLEPNRNASEEEAMIRGVLGELKSPGEFRPRLDELVKGEVPPNDPKWIELYAEACRKRRTQRLALLLKETPEVVFVKHYTLGGSHYAYTEGQSDAQAERHFNPGSALCLLRYDGSDVSEETLLADPGGVIRDPDVSYDGRRILFAWKKSDREDDYHLYEMDVETRKVRQLTFGLGVADYEGIYLPGGDIIFNSTRCVQIVDCWWTEVSNLYRCNGDGGAIRRLTFDQVHDNLPTVTEDNRILYTRWEYNDRGQIYPQPLMQMNPDGTNQSDFYGGNSWFPTTILHARGIPGTQKAIAVAAGHHTRQTGKLILLDPARGRQENGGAQLVAPERETPAERIDQYGQKGELFQYPYPLTENDYLVTYHPVGWDWKSRLGPLTGIYFMTRDGRRELLARDATIPCAQPIPLRPREARRPRASLVDYGKDTSTCYVQDVYIGPGLAGVPRGTIKTLRVVAIDYRIAGIGSNGNGGPGGGALVSTPVSIGNGTWDPKIILGDATVYDDGSVFFSLPARTPVYFQLLDERGQMVQTMRSWTTLQPGENASCVGCHEHKNSTPAASLPLTTAVDTGVEPLRPFYGPPRGFSFRKEIQPILDAKCASCHSAGQDEPVLTGEAVTDDFAKRHWNRAYLNLTHARPDNDQGRWRGQAEHPLVNWVSSQSAPPMLPPYAAGAATSGLIRLLTEGHEGVQLSRKEMDKLCAWLDLGVPFCGDYVESNAWNTEEHAKHEYYRAKREKMGQQDQATVDSLRNADH